MSDTLTKTRTLQHFTLRSALRDSILQDWMNNIHAAGIPMPKIRNIPNNMDMDLIYYPNIYCDTSFDPYTSFESNSTKSSNIMFHNTINGSILSERLKEFTFNTDEGIPNQKYTNVSTRSKRPPAAEGRYFYDFDSKDYASTIYTSSSKHSTSGTSYRTTSILTQPTHMMNFYEKTENPCYTSLLPKEFPKPSTQFCPNRTMLSTKYPIKDKSFLLSPYTKEDKYNNKPIYVAPKNPIFPAPKLSLQEYICTEQINHMQSMKSSQQLGHVHRISRKSKTNLNQNNEDTDIENVKKSFIYKKIKMNTSYRLKDNVKKRLKKRITLKHLEIDQNHIESDIDGYNADLEDVWCSD